MADTQKVAPLEEDSRQPAKKEINLRNWIKKGGEFPPEKGRYHLYISHACPWANRATIFINLKGLQDVISVSAVHYVLGEGGWRFVTPETPVQGCDPDPLGHSFLKEIYLENNPDLKAGFSVPLLYDLKSKRIVNNESAEIIRILNSEFNDFCATEEQRKLDLYSEDMREAIEEANSWILPNINSGVYKCGFATTQEAYDEAVEALFTHLEKADTILSQQRYIAGSRLTEADVRLFTTLIRFDTVMYILYKANLKRLSDFPHLHNYMLELYQMPEIKKTINFFHIKHGYFEGQRQVNPHGIVPIGPLFNYDVPHNRNKLGKPTKQRDEPNFFSSPLILLSLCFLLLPLLFPRLFF